MDRNRSILNVGVSIFFKIIVLIGSILVRRYLIRYLGNEINGLNSLYLSLVGFLSVAELGVGSAITFCMYKPVVEKDTEKIAALYQLFKKTYQIIGGVILILGIAILPALPYLAKDYLKIDVNLYVTFFLMLISVIVTFAFSAKTSLINAYKDNYITTTISSLGMVLQLVLQIGALILTGAYTAYLVCRILSAIAQWAVTEWIVNRTHKDVIACSKQKLDDETKSLVTKNIKALFMHKIGTALVNSTDSIIISAFIGVTLLGKYSNYTSIVVSMTSIISLFFIPLTSIIGHMYVTDAGQTKKYYEFFYSFNFITGILFFLGYYSIIDNLITILFGANLEVSKAISFVVTVNYFVQFMRQATLLFRDASGTFYNDRWKPLIESVLNIILSVALVLFLKKYWGDEIGLVGVIVATIITNLAICHVIEPYVLYKHSFHSSCKRHLIKNYLFSGIFVLALIILDRFMIVNSNQWVELLLNGMISLTISLIILVMVFLFDKNFRHYCKKILLRKSKQKNNKEE